MDAGRRRGDHRRVSHNVTVAEPLRAAVQQQVLRPAVAPQPKPTTRRFTVWMSSNIPAHYGSVDDIAAAVFALVPPGSWDEVELLLKAGEGGSWQAAFDPHPLAINSPMGLLERVQDGRAVGLRVSPYVVVRGRPEWMAGEVQMIRQCVEVAGRCVLNVEPG